jgi:predicted amidohydrolase YtcJ
MRAEDADPLFARALRDGIQIATHGIGDRGNALVLDAYARAFAAVPIKDRAIAAPRWRVEHAQIIRPADMPRFRDMGVIASMQPSHAIGDLYFAPARLGPARLDGAYAWRSLTDLGVVIAGGSDAPVEQGDPLIEFYAAVARRSLDGFQGPDWRPQEALDRGQALALFTTAPAFAAFEEKERGQLKPGMRADVSIFSVDLMRAPSADIPKGRALATIVDGRIAYRAKDW